MAADSENRKAILVTGAHRSGTTWVGKMLCASGEAAYISEPLNVWHRPGVLPAPVRHWYTYICPENEGAYLAGLQQTLAFRYHPWAEVKSLRSRKDLLRMGRDWNIFARGRARRQRPLLKDPFAVFSIPWFAGRLDCQVVVTVRHPFAFASSLKRLDWRFDFADLLAQPLLMRDRLEPYRAEMEAFLDRPEDIIGQASLLWRIIYQVVHEEQARRPDLLIIRHEDLSLNPLKGFRSLYAALGLTFNPKAHQAITGASGADNPRELDRRAVHSVQLDSRANLHNWKRRLKAEEIDRIRDLTQEAAGHFYPEPEWNEE